MSERYINNLTGDFSICFSEHLTEHPIYLVMKALALEVFSKDEMGFINGGGDVTANKTIINADGSTTIITTTIKDDGTVIIDKVTIKP